MTTYLDYAATAPLLPEVKAELERVLELELGNAAALHGPGQRAKGLIETAREHVARLIGAEPEEIVFTSGGTEANNMIMETFREQKILASSVEHPSVREAAKARAREFGELAVDEVGRVQMADLERKLVEQPDLVSVMLANNELGTLEPVEEVVKYCKSASSQASESHGFVDGRDAASPHPRHPAIHCDATQAFGKVKIDVKQLGVDYLTISAHKIGGPQGVGALYVRKGAQLKPLLYGGHQENKRRAGTSNVLAIAGFGKAAQWCWDNWSCRKWAEVAKLRDELKVRILKEVPYSSCNSPATDCLPNILNMSFQAAEGESIQLYLDAEGVIVSTGSACAAGDIKPSHVLMATRHDAEVAHSSIRFSLGLETTKADIERVMAVLPGVVRRLQGISTVKVSTAPSEESQTWASAPERLEEGAVETLNGRI